MDNPLYRFTLSTRPSFTRTGRGQVGALYKRRTDTNQAVCYVTEEILAVGDQVVMGRAIS